MEDLGRMEARVMQVLDRLQATVVTLSSAKLDDHIFLSGVMEADEIQADRVERLFRKMHGMESAIVVAETAAIERMIALFRILCDMTDRAEVLHFITALNARAIMVRPLWVAFEVVGTPQEIEGVYQSALAYGIVDVVSSSCALMTSENEAKNPLSIDERQMTSESRLPPNTSHRSAMATVGVARSRNEHHPYREGAD
jgi:acetolactate synthase small subunit